MLVTTEGIVEHVRDWALERASNELECKDDANALIAEFYEWIETGDEELKIVSLEPM